MSGGETIYALSSGPGKSGVAVIRVSGPRVIALIDRMCGGELTPRFAALRLLRHPETGDVLDQALCLYFPAPHSFTGEDILECHVHGGRAVVSAVLAALGSDPACRPADRGEFTFRAFRNGKLDLTEAEGLADLIDSETDRQRRHALAVLGGAHRDAVERWRARLIEAMALLEAGIDFADEGDVPDATRTLAEAPAREVLHSVASAVATFERGERLRDGVRVVIAGPPNAGKSTLLNALAGRDVAIVSSQPGTTRDVLEVRLDLGGVPVIVSDTAGFRVSTDDVEQEGVRRAERQVAAADLVLWLQAPDMTSDPLVSPPSRASRATVWSLASKVDLQPGAPPDGFAISAATGDGMDRLLAALHRFAAEAIGSSDDGALVTHERHHAALVRVSDALSRALHLWYGAPVELVAEELRRAAADLGRVTGAIDNEAVLDAVFQRFCIGK